ncbi:hypothetical protein ACFLTM_00045 [Candidatus Bipolaricaulota bacterium]
MAEVMRQESFSAELLEILEEVFDTHHGVLLDKGTSLFATLDRVSADAASTPIAAGTASIATHVEHVIYYLEVLGGDIAREDIGTVDWSEIWNRVSTVTTEEWNELRARLRARYAWLTEALDAVEDWEQNEAVGTAIAILAHTACHLGVIRQALAAAQASE